MDRTTPPAPEVAPFAETLRILLRPFRFVHADQYWKIETRSWTTPSEIRTYHLLFENEGVQLDVSIFDKPSRYFVDLEFKNKNAPETHNTFSLLHFCRVTEFKDFDDSPGSQRGAQYLERYADYLKRLFEYPVAKEILKGDYWFPFFFDFRDMASDPTLLPKKKEQFLESRSGKSE